MPTAQPQKSPPATLEDLERYIQGLGKVCAQMMASAIKPYIDRVAVLEKRIVKLEQLKNKER